MAVFFLSGRVSAARGHERLKFFGIHKLRHGEKPPANVGRTFIINHKDNYVKSRRASSLGRENIMSRRFLFRWPFDGRENDLQGYLVETEGKPA